jgi:hypothetical protein
LGGYFIGQIAMPIDEFNSFAVILIYAGLPVIIMFLGFYIGWYAKSKFVIYDPPNWEFQALGLTPDECSKRIRVHNKHYIRIVAYSNYWLFFLPPILALLSVGFPFYAFYEDSIVQNYIPITFSIVLFANFIISEYGSYRASFNSASNDFTLPLVREAIELAKTQSTVEGISMIHVVLDHASVGDYHVYKNPRVVARVYGIEKEAYIESCTEDIGAIERLYIRLNPTSESEQVLWWWQSRDRTFRKYVGEDNDGYYVQSPVPSSFKELGVKDVKLVTENAVALLLLEWTRINGGDPESKEILSKLGVMQV